MIESREIKYGAMMSYITICFNLIAGFAYTPWMIKVIGQSQYGLYTLSISIITIFVMDLGLGNTISRFIARYRAENNEDKVKDILGLTIKLYLAIDVVILFVFAIIYFNLGNIYVKLTSSELEQFKLVFLVVGLFSILSFPFMPQNGVFTAYGKIFSLKLMDLLNKAFKISTTILCLLLGYKLLTLVLINVVFDLITNLTKYFYLVKKVRLRINIRYRSKELFKKIFTFSFWVTIAMFADSMFFTMAPTVLGIFTNSVQISIFAIGTSIEGYTYTFANALNGVFLPKVMKMVVKKEDSSIMTDLLIKVGRIQLIIISAVILPFLSMGQEFILLWLGNSFSQSYLVIVFLTIPCLVTHTQGIAVEMTYATDNVKYRAMIYVASGILSVLVSCLLAPWLGAIGTAIGIFVAFTLGLSVAMNIFYSKILKLKIWRFFSQCHLRMLIPFVVMVIFGFVLQYTIPVNSMVLFLVKGVIWEAVFGMILWLFVLNKFEKDLIANGVLKKILRRFKRA